MLDQHDGPLALERLDQADDVRRVIGRHPRHRLVEQQDPRASRQGQPELEFLMNLTPLLTNPELCGDQ